MNIPIKTNTKDFFKVYLEVMNPVFKLKKREKQVMAAYLKVFYANRGLEREELNAKLFSTPVKKMIRNSIGMSEPSFNNHLGQLRGKRALIDDSIHHLLVDNLPTEGLVDVNFNIIIIDGE